MKKEIIKEIADEDVDFYILPIAKKKEYIESLRRVVERDKKKISAQDVKTKRKNIGQIILLILLLVGLVLLIVFILPIILDAIENPINI